MAEIGNNVYHKTKYNNKYSKHSCNNIIVPSVPDN